MPNPSDTRYPVLYMHDGQNLFDPASAYGSVDGGIDEALLRLIHEHGLPGAVIVGIWNSGEGRWLDYMPQQAGLNYPPCKQRLTSGAGRPGCGCVPTATSNSWWRS